MPSFEFTAIYASKMAGSVLVWSTASCKVHRHDL